MFRLHCDRTIACSHKLHQHDGKCQNLHGHNFRIVVDIEASKLIEGGSSDGMVMDFGDVKRIIDQFDHTHLNHHVAIVSYIGAPLYGSFTDQPTAERFAQILALEIYNTSKNCYITSVKVRVYETETQYAEFILNSTEV